VSNQLNRWEEGIYRFAEVTAVRAKKSPGYRTPPRAMAHLDRLGPLWAYAQKHFQTIKANVVADNPGSTKSKRSAALSVRPAHAASPSQNTRPPR
jgi:hypothetical protein